MLDPPPPRSAPPLNSHYLQSKVVRAKERLEAEMQIAKEDAAFESAEATSPTGEAPSGGPGAPSGSSSTTQPPPSS